MIVPFDANHASKGRGHNQIANITPVRPPFKMSVEIIREKDCVAKYWPQSTQDHELVVNVRTEQPDGANSTLVFAPPLRLFIFELTRESTKEVRLIQSFSCLFGRRLHSPLALLFILAFGWLSLFTGKTAVDTAQISVR